MVATLEANNLTDIEHAQTHTNTQPYKCNTYAYTYAQQNIDTQGAWMKKTKG